MLLVELIFNFTCILKENYKKYQKNNHEYFSNEDTTTAKPITYNLKRINPPNLYSNDEEYGNMPIKQVILNGSALYVIDIGSLPTSLVLLKKSDNKILSLNSDGTLSTDIVSEYSFDKTQQFNIFRITDYLSFNRHVSKQAINSNNITFPFFVIKPASDSTNKYLGYDGNNFIVSDSFSITNNMIKNSDVKYKDSDTLPTKQFNISLNFSEKSKEKLFDKIEALDFSSFTPSGKPIKYTEKNCDENKKNLIPKRAVESLCLSCNPDLIQ
tara:strand:+ start:3701 stop:4507 length:807 start_codon:yes stop_codon:yes gene_type:complete